MKRRNFVQQTGLALLSLGISDTGLSLLGDNSRLAILKRYSQSLAEPTARKLALLVGINEYSQNLNGCLTDVELQQELLIHRFGFQPQDIITLTDKQATRENVETAFVEHLIQQTKAGDVVVFHFSGYGSQVKILSSDLSTEKLANCLVVKDNANLNDNYLLIETLLSLGRSLATDKLTMVLDTSYEGRDNLLLAKGLRVRSFPVASRKKPTSEELVFLQQLATILNTSKKVKQTKIPGIILAAAKEKQFATEGKWQGFSAGLFTYSLTQYLWQVTPASTIQVSLKRAAERVERVRGLLQQPEIKGNDKQPLFTYYLLPENQPGAEGIITSVEETDTVDLKLLGFTASLLENYGINSYFTVVDQGKDPGIKLQIQSRDGLKAKARIIEPNSTKLKVGQLVQESMRILPRNLGLTVALASNLTRIEKVDATSALSNISVVSAVINAGEQGADICLGKLQDIQSEVEATEEIKEIYGLFTVGGAALANSVGFANEAVKSMVKRLDNQLSTILAAKLWRLTENEGSSRLGVRATLENVEANNQPLLQRETRRFAGIPTGNSQNKSSVNLDSEADLLPGLKLGTRIQYRLENYADYPIYFFLIGTNSNGQAIALKSAADKNLIIPPRETVLFPDKNTSLNWIISGSIGLADIQLIFSKSPLQKTLQTLGAITNNQEQVTEIIQISNPLKIAKSLLEDLQNASVTPGKFSNIRGENYILDVQTWATLNFIYQVI